MTYRDRQAPTVFPSLVNMMFVRTHNLWVKYKVTPKNQVRAFHILFKHEQELEEAQTEYRENEILLISFIQTLLKVSPMQSATKVNLQSQQNESHQSETKVYERPRKIINNALQPLRRFKSTCNYKLIFED